MVSSGKASYLSISPKQLPRATLGHSDPSREYSLAITAGTQDLVNKNLLLQEKSPACVQNLKKSLFYDKEQGFFPGKCNKLA
jgi:hypothetical protein